MTYIDPISHQMCTSEKCVVLNILERAECPSAKKKKGHGMAGRTNGKRTHRFYRIWNILCQRTSNPKSYNYHLYGARGIKNKWPSFEAFRDDMYESYLAHVKEFGESNTSIDRIDTDGDYEPSNCRWATMKEQQNNRRDVRRYMFQGKERTVPEIAKMVGTLEQTMYSRVFRFGHPLICPKEDFGFLVEILKRHLDSLDLSPDEKEKLDWIMQYAPIS